VASVLDTWALLALLNDESPAARVEEAWQKEEPIMCSVNLGEALYLLIRAHGEEEGTKTVDRVRAELNVVDSDWRLVAEAAGIKAHGGLSYADCFALATARRHRAPLWTGDPEIVDFADEGEVEDLRRAPSGG
jgi:predicted nucleic acid-binding protein